jgi:peroxiredoxin
MRYIFKILFISFSIFMTLIVVQNAGCKEGKIGVEVGNLAPDFNLLSLEGQSVSLRDYEGRAVLLSFGTTWCPYCIKEIPELKNIYKNIPEVTVIYIDIKESKAKVEALVKKYKIPYLVLLDEDASIASKYKVVGVPTVLLIDKKGIIRYRGNVIPKNLEDLLKTE